MSVGWEIVPRGPERVELDEGSTRELGEACWAERGVTSGAEGHREVGERREARVEHEREVLPKSGAREPEGSRRHVVSRRCICILDHGSLTRPVGSCTEH